MRKLFALVVVAIGISACEALTDPFQVQAVICLAKDSLVEPTDTTATQQCSDTITYGTQ